VASLPPTELVVYVVASAMVLIAAMILDESGAGGFGARQAWLYFTILSAGYMIRRLSESSWNFSGDPGGVTVRR
jgi:hypothetical protein